MKISKKRLIIAIRNLVLFSAIIHMILLTVFAFIRKDINILNYFNVLDLDFIWPEIIEGPYSPWISLVVALGITAFFYFRAPVAKK